MKNKTISRLILCLATIGLHPFLSGAQPDEFGSTISAMVNDHIMLGTAYHSGKTKFLNHQPVEGIVTEDLGNVEFIIKLIYDMNYSDTLKVLNGNVDLTVEVPVVRITAGGHIAKEISVSDFGSSYTFHVSATPKKRHLEPNDSNQGFTLSPVGHAIATDYPLKLLELAGDEFVTSIEYGARMLVNMKIDFLNESSKSDIGGHLKVDLAGGVASVDGRLNFISEDEKNSVRITVRAMQSGGDPIRLLGILPDNIVTCTLNNPEPCFNLFAEAIDYAKNKFTPQFEELSDYNVVRYYTTPYVRSSLDLKRLASEYQEIEYSTSRMILDLEDLFKTAVVHEQRAADLIRNYYSWMPTSQQKSVEDIKASAYDNAWIYYENAKYCRDHPYGDTCISYVNERENVCNVTGNGCIIIYDSDLLGVPAPDISRWFQCERAREKATDNGLETNLNSLAYRKLRWAPVFVNIDDLTDGIVEWAPCEFALSTYGDHVFD